MEKKSLALKLPLTIIATSLGLSLALCLAIIGFRYKGGMEFLELAAYDKFVRLRAAAQKSGPVKSSGTSSDSPKTVKPVPAPEISPEIAIVGMSEEDIQRMGRWPLPDSTIARLIDSIEKQRPRDVGLDIYRDMPNPPGTEQLRETFKKYDNIITVQKIGDEHNVGIPPPFMATDPNLVGFNDLPVDADGVIRRALLFIDDGKNVFSSFALLMALAYLRADGISPAQDGSYLRLGKTSFVPLAHGDGGYADADVGGYQFLLDFKNRPIPTYSLVDTLNGKLPNGALTGKLVIVGIMAESVKDIFFIPLKSSSFYFRGTYGMQVHAMIAGQIIRAARGEAVMARFMNRYQAWAWIIAWGLTGGMLGLWIRSFGKYFAVAMAGAVSVVVLSYVVFLRGWWIPMVPGALAWLGSSAVVTAYLSFHEKRDRAVLMQLFSRHVSNDVAEAIWDKRSSFMAEGRLRTQKLVATVLFTDLKGFTTISEHMEAPVLMDWLNEYMEAMASAVIDNGGVVNKYIGDAVMAFFGVPVARDNESEISRDAMNAVSCALDMERRLEVLNSLWQKRGLPQAHMRVGINTGPLVAGSLGSSKRMEYTVIGDTVNTASRLESFDKDYAPPAIEGRHCRILVGEATYERLGGGFNTIKVGEASLKGKGEKITVYLVVGKARELPAKNAGGPALRQETKPEPKPGL